MEFNEEIQSSFQWLGGSGTETRGFCTLCYLYLMNFTLWSRFSCLHMSPLNKRSRMQSRKQGERHPGNKARFYLTETQIIDACIQYMVYFPVCFLVGFPFQKKLNRAGWIDNYFSSIPFLNVADCQEQAIISQSAGRTDACNLVSSCPTCHGGMGKPLWCVLLTKQSGVTTLTYAMPSYYQNCRSAVLKGLL